MAQVAIVYDGLHGGCTVNVEHFHPYGNEMWTAGKPETQHTFAFKVWVKTDTEDHAKTVMTERLGVDEDYGFDYQITDWGLEKDSSDPVETQDRLTLHAAEAHGITDDDRQNVIETHDLQHQMTEQIISTGRFPTHRRVYEHFVDDLYLAIDEDTDTANADERMIEFPFMADTPENEALIAQLAKQAPEGSSDRVETQRMSPSPAGGWGWVTGSLVQELEIALKRATAITSALMNEVKRERG